MLVHNTRQLWTRSLSHISAMHRRENLPHFARYEKDEGKKACKAKEKKEEAKKKKLLLNSSKVTAVSERSPKNS